VLFKASPEWKKAPHTKNALVKAEHKRKMRDAILKFIHEMTLPSQRLREVSGDGAEAERLPANCLPNWLVRSLS